MADADIPRPIDISHWLEQIQKRAENCFIQDGAVMFKVTETHTYEIPLADCDTYSRIIAWQLHLMEKNWITTDLLVSFTLHACDYHHLPISYL